MSPGVTLLSVSANTGGPMETSVERYLLNGLTSSGVNE